MNEQTKQLWEKAQVWDSSDDGRGGLKIRESVEKFAELIVRECADIAAMNQFQWDSAGGYVLKHFGIKE